jgi:hypothetical protein
MKQCEYSFFICHGCREQKPRSERDKTLINRQQCNDCSTAIAATRDAMRAVAAKAGTVSRLYSGAAL